MAFTYDGDPSTPLERVRFELGDTIRERPLFQDEEIIVKLDERGGNVLLTAADLCDVLATKFARGYDVELDGEKLSRSQRVKHFAERARELRRRAGGIAVVSVTKVDGYSDDLSSRDGAGQAGPGGRVRAGYFDPDLPA